MKIIVILIGAFALLGTGYLVSHVNAEPVRAVADDSATRSFIGRPVKVYFRQADKVAIAEIPGANLTFLGGKLITVDATFLSLVSEGGDDILVPLSSVAYVRANAPSPTTKPN